VAGETALCVCSFGGGGANYGGDLLRQGAFTGAGDRVYVLDKMEERMRVLQCMIITMYECRSAVPTLVDVLCLVVIMVVFH